ncbi:hypothetical protein C8J56DRAFT_768493 [Mycena floridula]|nr:hypothetical protein C8J56DRAFT_768493 [Mycena floridula]
MGHHHHIIAEPARIFLADYQTESTFEQIPIIDFADMSSTDPVVRRELADRIRDACINVGFFYINNHGIPPEVISRAVEAAQRFFSLPSASKMDIDIHKSSNFKGYTALLGENTDPTGQGDLHEGFDLGWEEANPEGNNARDDGAMSGRNIWPDGLPGFREEVLSYYHAAVRLGQSLFPLFALALDLPENFFDDKTTKPAAIMRLLHYPPQHAWSVEENGKIIGIGAHTEYCFTILWQDDVGGLQVQNTDGNWIDAVPIPGTLVLNLGDQFARWTNDVFKSTLHRAINRSGAERYSMPLFFGTDYDVLLEPLPSCVSSENPLKYDVVTAGDYVKSRLETTYAHSASD